MKKKIAVMWVVYAMVFVVVLPLITFTGIAGFVYGILNVVENLMRRLEMWAEDLIPGQYVNCPYKSTLWAEFKRGWN